MGLPEIVTADIILTPAVCYRAPVGTAEPALTVAAGGDWGTDWTFVGELAEPLKFAYEFDVAERKVQSMIGIIKRARTMEKLDLETVLAEFTMNKQAFAMGGTATSVAATSTVPGYEQLAMGGEVHLPESMFGFEGKYTDDDGNTFPIRCFIWRVTSKAGGELEFSNEDFVGIPLKLGALTDPAKPKGQRLFKMIRITAPATGGA